MSRLKIKYSIVGAFLLVLSLIFLVGLISGCGGVGQDTYNVSGQVLDNEGDGIEGVSLNFSRGFGSAETDEDGKWSKSGLKGTVTVTPIKEGWEFEPQNRKTTVEASNLNFTGQEKLPVIEEEFSLEPEGIIKSVDGVRVGAPPGALDQEIKIKVGRLKDPGVDFPDFIKDEFIVGDFYTISSNEVYFTQVNNEMLLGLPVPEGVSTEDLVVARYTQVGSDWLGGEPEEIWEFLIGAYDEEEGLFGVLLSGVYDEPLVFVLLEIEGYGADLNRLEMQSNSQFYVYPSLPLRWSPHWGCSETRKGLTITQETLDEAYSNWKALGYSEPALKKKLEDVSFSDLKTSRGLYKYQLRLDGSPQGAYSPSEKWAYTRLVRDGFIGGYFPILTTRHELFHAFQFGFFYSSWDIPWDLIEGTADLASNSVDELNRSDRGLDNFVSIGHPVFQHLFSEKKAINDNYFIQDFWLFLGKSMAGGNEKATLDFLIPLFEAGGLKSDIEYWFLQDNTFDDVSDAYWQWAKEYSFEKQVIPSGSCNISQKGGEPGEWWAPLGYYDPIIFKGDKELKSFELKPLSSKALAFALESSNKLGLSVKASELDNIMFKFYDGTTNIDRWVDNQSIIKSVKGQEKIVKLILSNTSIDETSGEITVKLIPYYTLSIRGQGEGTVEITEVPVVQRVENNDSNIIGEFEYKEGTVIQLKGIPDDGWEFSRWEGDVENPHAKETLVTMNEDKEVIAIFEEEINDGIGGKVTIKGEIPDREITVTLNKWDWNEEKTVIADTTKTDEKGNYFFDYNVYRDLDFVWIRSSPFEDYSLTEIEKKKIVTHTAIEWFTPGSGYLEMPDLDIYTYNLELLSPYDGEIITTLPYEVEINHYEREVSGRYYRLYFSDLDESYQIGISKDNFYSDSFLFSGELDSGEFLDKSASWLVSGQYQAKGYDINVNVMGNNVYFDEEDVETLDYLEIFESPIEIPKPGR